MRRAEWVVWAFRPLGEPRKPVLLAQRADTVPPPGENLVRIALVRHVPDQLVLGRIEDSVQRDRQLDHTQTRPKVAPGFRNGRDGFRAQFVCQCLQLGIAQPLHVGRHVHTVQNRRIGSFTQRGPPANQNSREITKRAAARKLSARASYVQSASSASATRARARAFASSRPSRDTKVAFPASASL